MEAVTQEVVAMGRVMESLRLNGKHHRVMVMGALQGGQGDLPGHRQ